jgi:hypothetical protein
VTFPSRWGKAEKGRAYYRRKKTRKNFSSTGFFDPYSCHHYNARIFQAAFMSLRDGLKQ